MAATASRPSAASATTGMPADPRISRKRAVLAALRAQPGTQSYVAEADDGIRSPAWPASWAARTRTAFALRAE